MLAEELAYPGIRHAAGLVRAGIVGIPLDAEGLLPDALDRIAMETGAQMLVTSSNAQNPTTIRTSPDRRRRIVEVARQRGLQIVDDDCFGFDQGTDPAYRLLAPERSWVVSSLSKTLSPDLRVGAVLGPPGQTEPARIAAQQQFFGLSRPLLDLVTQAMATGAATDIAAIGGGYGMEAVTVTSPEDLQPVRDWVASGPTGPMLVHAKGTADEPSWWLEEAFRGH